MLDYPKSEMTVFVNAMLMQRCDAPLTNADCSYRILQTFQSILATTVTKLLDHYTFIACGTTASPSQRLSRKLLRYCSGVMPVYFLN